MKLIDDVARDLLEELRDRLDETTARGRLEQAIGPCVSEGGREQHLELVLSWVEGATKDER